LRGVASACGSATVVNAIATGKGAAFGIELGVRAEAELLKTPGKIECRILGKPKESTKLAEICARKVLDRLGLADRFGARVTTTSDLPIAVGLSSSSAAANAVVLATLSAAHKELSRMEVLDLGVDAAIEAGVTITGAFDDAAASLLRCGVITDNLRRRVLKQFRVDEGLDVLVYVPPTKLYTAEVDVSKVKRIKGLVGMIHQRAFQDPLGALTLNGLAYCHALGHDPMPAIDALSCGALAAGLTGTGPAFVAVAEPEATPRIRKLWENRAGRVLLTKPARG